LFVSFPGQDAVIVSNRAKRLEGTKPELVEFVSISNFGDTTDDDLSRQSRGLSDLGVVSLVNGVLSKDQRMESKFTDGVTSFVGLLNGLLEKFGLLFGWIELDLCDQLHSESIVCHQVLNNHKVIACESDTNFLRYLEGSGLHL
jgi:hypothetical protein